MKDEDGSVATKLGTMICKAMPREFRSHPSPCLVFILPFSDRFVMLKVDIEQSEYAEVCKWSDMVQVHHFVLMRLPAVPAFDRRI